MVAAGRRRACMWGAVWYMVLAFTIVPHTMSASGKGGAGSTTAPVDSSQQIAARIVESKVPVLIDFWAAWCKPCQMVDPIIKALEKEYRGRVLFLKINIDVHRRIAGYFGVTSIPMIYLVKDKQVQAAIPGVRTKDFYRAQIEKVLASKQEPDTTAAASHEQASSSVKADTTKQEAERE